MLDDSLDEETAPRMEDPRSPNCEVDRTPIIAKCDVHRNWDDEDMGECVITSGVGLTV